VTNAAASNHLQEISQQTLPRYRAACVERRLPQNDPEALEKPHMPAENKVDFLPTGKGGAICLRYGSPGNYRVMVYDGGNFYIGKELIQHIREHYGTNVVDDLICSHPDAYHGEGLATVLKEMEVRNLWMHRPWAHSALSSRYFGSGNIADISHAAHLKDKMAAAYALEQLTFERDIQLSEPFQGARIGPFTVLSPHYDWYVHALLPAFEGPCSTRPISPEMEQLLRQAGVRTDDQATLPPAWMGETPQRDETSAENESSVILFGVIGGQGVLLTGNAGTQALSAAIGYAESKRISVPAYRKFVKVEQEVPRARMKVVNQVRDSWFLLTDGQEYYLDVHCSLAHSRFSLLINLTEGDYMEYKTKGLPLIQAIAERVQRSPTSYYGQNQSVHVQKSVVAAIMAWNRQKKNNGRI
jgi:hypothetical protein